MSATVEVDRIRANRKDISFGSATLALDGTWWVQLRGGNLETILGQDVIQPVLLEMELRDGRKASGTAHVSGVSGDAPAARLLVTLEGREKPRFE
ncbi:MAG: hypothetical protein C4521_09415 [Actinobacteria bacterium]|nr:MAG: hypothetical protein C4521_09415 [Actinomycetota bacterium]